jgi:hypothetical protein
MNVKTQIKKTGGVGLRYSVLFGDRAPEFFATIKEATAYARGLDIGESRVEQLVKGLQRIAMRDPSKDMVSAPDYQDAFEMCQLIAYETIKIVNPEFKGKPIKV